MYLSTVFINPLLYKMFYAFASEFDGHIVRVESTNVYPDLKLTFAFPRSEYAYIFSYWSSNKDHQLKGIYPVV